MKVIDQYVHDVTRRLPEQQRKDVAKELKTEILEMVDDEASGKRPTKDHAYAVLKRMGRPAKLADSYRDRPRYVIGPEYYESYIDLLKTLMVVVLPIVAFLTLMTQLMTTNDTLIKSILNAAGGSIAVAIHIFFWTTAVFFVVEKTMQGKRYDEAKEWTPDELPDVPPKQQISRTESYFSIAWSLFAVAATLFQVPAVHQVVQANIPLFFSAEFWPGWTLGLLAISILSVIVELIKMIVGGWTKFTVALITILNIAVTVFFVAAFYLIDPIVNPEFIALIEKTFHIQNATQSFETGIAIFVAAIAAISIWEITDAIIKYKKGGKS